MKHRYIVIEGTIGSGKSKLAKRLAEHWNATLLTEPPEHNPFLAHFYANAAHNGLATELQFLLQRVESVATIGRLENQNQTVLADFLLEKDQIFVPVILDGRGSHNEQTLYWELKRRLLPEYPIPDLVIYLQAGSESRHKQLQHSTAARYFPEGYIHDIDAAYHRFFHLYDNAPLLTVNTDGFSPESDEHFALLLDTIAQMKGSRHHLNFSA